ncbi:PTS glucose transporter subunit IIA [Brachybacterium huguangmaarense]|uniref:PTS glucose transporter subunit IIA n=1 Tax=Brachybacterium huguangmaarense TaxID=1652028 RepID=A0ABY6G2Z9_9MICO|nr:PTS glucose transporter subunit IIA [Brachybacterium huguangmaarense]UYG17590.1 PTS glucose transporter subunit IIA [Brachybacterium huguangmaarense]
MFGFGRKKNHDDTAITVGAPGSGSLVELADVPDPVFSRGLVGPGFAVDLTDGSVVAPVAGEVILVPETLHAVGIRAANGAEILVHVGVDSVALKGQGFTARCAPGDVVEADQVLLEVDLETVRHQIPSVVTPVVVSNADAYTVEGPFLDATGDGILVVRSR